MKKKIKKKKNFSKKKRPVKKNHVEKSFEGVSAKTYLPEIIPDGNHFFNARARSIAVKSLGFINNTTVYLIKNPFVIFVVIFTFSLLRSAFLVTYGRVDEAERVVINSYPWFIAGVILEIGKLIFFRK